MKKNTIGILVLVIVCVIALVINILVRREPAGDQIISDDFSAIRDAIESSTSSQYLLGGTFDTTKLPATMRDRLKNYNYAATTDGYKLCATFKTARVRTGSEPVVTSAYEVDFAIHPKGYYCFDVPRTSARPN